MMRLDPRTLDQAKALNSLEWYAVRMVAPTNGHRRTAMLGGNKRKIKLRTGQTVERRTPGTGKRVFVPEHILAKAGFAVFMPVKKRWRRKHRWTSEQELISYPYLVDWLFVGWPVGYPRWHDLSDLRVVSGILGSGGKPIRVPAKTIGKMMMVWGDGVPPAVRRAVSKSMQALISGDEIKVVSGPFEDFDGVVIDADGEGARVAINIFGRDTPVSFAFDEVMPKKAQSGMAEGLLQSGAPACLRCGEPMVFGHDDKKNHHLKCNSCGATGALNSASQERAMDAWVEYLNSL